MRLNSDFRKSTMLIASVNNEYVQYMYMKSLCAKEKGHIHTSMCYKIG